jgi:hypothetical protein
MADIHLLKLQRPIGNFPKRTPVHDLHTAFNIAYVYDYEIKLCRKQAKVIQNHENAHVRGTGQGEARHRKYNRLTLSGVQIYDRSNDYAAVVA